MHNSLKNPYGRWNWMHHLLHLENGLSYRTNSSLCLVHVLWFGNRCCASCWHRVRLTECHTLDADGTKTRCRSATSDMLLVCFPSCSSLGKTMSCFRTLRMVYVIDLQHLLTVVLYTLQMWGKNREKFRGIYWSYLPLFLHSVVIFLCFFIFSN